MANTTATTEQKAFRYQPKQIIEDVEVNVHIAWFDHDPGMQYVVENKLKQTTKTDELYFKNKYMICCGEVAVKIADSDYPSIERRRL